MRAGYSQGRGDGVDSNLDTLCREGPSWSRPSIIQDNSAVQFLFYTLFVFSMVRVFHVACN